MTPDEIKAIREANALTQAQLAEICGVGRPAATMWESGERRMGRPSEMLLKIWLKGREND